MPKNPKERAIAELKRTQRPSMWWQYGTAAVSVCLVLFTLLCLFSPMWHGNPLFLLGELIAGL